MNGGVGSELKYSTTTSSHFSGGYVNAIYIPYCLTKKQLATNNAKIASIAKTAKSKGSKSAKIKYIHDYLVKYTAYATEKSHNWSKVSGYLNYTSYGALQKHRAYCEGYSVAFARIAKEAGLKDVYVVRCASGSDTYNHAINRIGTRYYDVTWDDPSINGWDGGPKGTISYTYYDRTKAWMKDHGHRF